MSIDEAVRLAVAEHARWHRTASPSSRYAPRRVIVDCPLGRGLRQPFRRKGHWCVRMLGTARLVDPRRNENGDLVFSLDYSRPATDAI